MWTFARVLWVAALVCGCAASQSGPPPLSTAPLSKDTEALSYQLSKKEQRYGCKKLTGIMQVRILQIRNYDKQEKPSLVARGVQSVTTPVLGGTTVGIDPDGQYAKDLAMLEAYNRQLAAKKCKTFDLAAELNSSGLYDMPSPTKENKSP